MDFSKIDLIELTNIYFQQNNLAQGITEEEFVEKYLNTLEKISINVSNYKKTERDEKKRKYLNL